MDGIEEVVDPKLLADRYRDKVYAAYRDVFNSVSGKMVLDDLKKSFNDRTTFVEGDPYASAYNEGKRALYLVLLWTIRQGEEVVQHQEIELGRIKKLTEVVD
jgi:hypothetical protein